MTNVPRYERSREARREPWGAILVALFLLVIGLPLAANLTGADGADPGAENREMAAFPRLEGSWKSAANFGNGLGRWFDDHFGFRAALVRWFGETRLFWLGVSPSSTVIKGRGGWLFYADDSALDDYVAETPFTPVELRAWRATLVATNDWLNERGVRFVFTIAPDKHVIYPEQMPASLHRVGETSRTDQLFAYLRETTDLDLVDVRPALFEAQGAERLYHLTDTHWNDRGAFVAYREIIEAVRRKVPSVPAPWNRSDFEPVTRDSEGRDLAGMIGLTRVLRESDLELVPRRPRQARVVEPPGANPTDEEGRLVTEITGSRLPRALIIRDSFASGLAPFLSEHFGRAVYLWQNYVGADAVLQEKPTVVIQEIVGRHLLSVTPYNDVANQH
jgi:alginate O-acetyltransferase complex protein AlgJ